MVNAENTEQHPAQWAGVDGLLSLRDAASAARAAALSSKPTGVRAVGAPRRRQAP
jgi:hypothetical protein